MKLLKLFPFLFIFCINIINAQTVITGTLTGYDGKPISPSTIVLKQPYDESIIKQAVIDKNGNYKIEIDTAGLWILYFTGVFHAPCQIAVYADKPENINLDVRLTAYKYFDDLSKVSVVGNFNGWSLKSATPMLINTGGIYAAEIESPVDTVIYRLQNVVNGDLLEGTQADYYEYNGYSGYNSVIISKPGRVNITFNPAQLIRSESGPQVVFSDPASRPAKLAEIYRAILLNRSNFKNTLDNFISAGNSQKNFKYDCSKDTCGLAAAITNENDDVIRHALLMEYLDFAAFRVNLDTGIIKYGISDFSPSSTLWAINPGVMSEALYLAGYNNAGAIAYIEEAAIENKMEIVRQSAIFRIKYMPKITDAAPSKYHARVEEVLDKILIVKEGKKIPSFLFTSIDDSAKTLTNDRLLGKNYLIDFWATWCAPCVGEMKTLNEAFEKYKNNNLIIISVSFDHNLQDLTAFRKDKWKIPWFNMYASGKTAEKILKDFGIEGLPSPILVNEKGIVVATQFDLRGDNLDKTLAKLLDSGNDEK